MRVGRLSLILRYAWALKRCPETSQEGAQCIHNYGHSGDHFATDAFAYYSWPTRRAA